MKVLTRRSLIVFLVGLLAGCQPQVQPTPKPIPNQLTTVALTPTAQPTLEPTITPTAPPVEASPTTEAGLEPTPGPDATPDPAATPSPTPAPALGGVSFCATPFGAAGDERFSAGLSDLSLGRNPNGDQVQLRFELGQGQLAGVVRCLPPEAATVLGDTSAISSVIQIDLPLWRHDNAWRDSAAILNAIPRIGDSRHVRAILARSAVGSAGTTIEIGLSQALPFAVKVEGGTLTVTIADTPGTLLDDDPLGGAAGQPRAPSRPIVFTQGGDLFRYESARVEPVATTLDIESDFAISPDGNRVAFCRSAGDALPSQGALWISDLDGDNERLLADVGGCAEPAWSLDGIAIWFVAPTSATPAPSFALWTVAAGGGDAALKSPLDEWSRHAPQPLPNGDVLTVGEAEGGRGALLVTSGAGGPLDGSSSALGQSELGGYARVNSALLAVDGTQVAVEAVRADGGADLLVLDEAGKLKQRFNGQWWVRPLAWSPSGTLYYLAVNCRSGSVLSYALHSWDGADDTTVAEGATLGDIGQAVALDDSLAYVRAGASTLAERGPRPLLVGPSELWLLEPQTGARARLLSSPDSINGVR